MEEETVYYYIIIIKSCSETANIVYIYNLVVLPSIQPCDFIYEVLMMTH